MGAIKSLYRQSVLGKGDLDQVLWLCLADDLIAPFSAQLSDGCAQSLCWCGVCIVVLGLSSSALAAV